MTVIGVLIGGVKGGIPLWATRLEQGLASAAIGLVALAAYRMSTSLATDKLTRALALIAGSVTVLYSAPWLLPVIMVTGGLTSFIFDAFVAPLARSWKEARETRENGNKTKAKDPETGHVAQEMELPSRTDSNFVDTDADDEYGGPSTIKTPSIHSSIRSRFGADSAPMQSNSEDLETDTTARKTFSYSKKLGFAFFLVFLIPFIAAILVRALVPISPTAQY
ncbi:hypothetical protein BGZ98_001878, partial [Dissophora globulifera]